MEEKGTNQNYKLMQGQPGAATAPEESKVRSINHSPNVHIQTQQPKKQAQPASEFDDLHQMLINTKGENGVAKKRSSHSTSHDGSANDVAFNDSAYQVGYQTHASHSSVGKTTLNSRAAAAKEKEDMSYFLFKSIPMRKSTLTAVVTTFLVIALLMERFCFIVTVYKTRYYGYVLILIVIFLNCIFNFALSRLRKKPQKKRLHELFNIERTPNVGWCVIGIIGALDMLYAFFLFWPANMIPVYLLVALLQFFIPLNMLFRSCCLGLKHYAIHVIAGFVILLATILSMVDLADYEEGHTSRNYMRYALLFLLCSLFDVVSHALKESIVRNQPLNQEKFNFRISMAQLVVGIIITPFILQVSKEYEDYSHNEHIEDPKNMPLGEFMKDYFREGFNCLLELDDDQKECHWSFLYLLGYVFSLFVLQLSLTYLMSAKSTKFARVIFSLMVPLTLGAFMLGSVAEPTIAISAPDWMDVVALIVVGVGVWCYNWFEEKPQKASIENL